MFLRDLRPHQEIFCSCQQYIDKTPLEAGRIAHTAHQWPDVVCWHPSGSTRRQHLLGLRPSSIVLEVPMIAHDWVVGWEHNNLHPSTTCCTRVQLVALWSQRLRLATTARWYGQQCDYLPHRRSVTVMWMNWTTRLQRLLLRKWRVWRVLLEGQLRRLDRDLCVKQLFDSWQFFDSCVD